MNGKKWWVALGLLAALGLTLRLVGIGWGIPAYELGLPASRPYHHTYHMDEDNFLWALARMRPSEGNFDVRDYHWGTLQHYLIYGALLAGSAVGAVPSPWEEWFVRGDPEVLPRLYVLGRLVSVAMGVACVLLVAGLGAALGGRLAGVGAGVAYAIAPLPVVGAHYLTNDVTMSALVAASVLCAVAAAQRGKLAWLAAAGLLLGLAAAAKYSAAFAAPAILVAQWGVWRAGRVAGVRTHVPWIALLPWLAAVCGFLLGEPYALVPGNLASGLEETVRGNAPDLSLGIGSRLEMLNWQTYYLASLGLTWPLALLALVGLAVLVARVAGKLWRGARDLPASGVAPAVVLAALVGLTLGLALNRVHMLRYSQPLVPLLAVAAGVGWAALPLTSRHLAVGSWQGLRRAAGASRLLPLPAAYRWAVGGLAVLVAGWVTWGQLALMSGPHPANEFQAWLRLHLRPGQQVARLWPEYTLLDPERYTLVRLDPWRPDVPGEPLPDYIIMDDMLLGPPTEGLVILLTHWYTEAIRFSARPSVGALKWDEGPTPHDWKYSHPTLVVYVRTE